MVPRTICTWALALGCAFLTACGGASDGNTASETRSLGAAAAASDGQATMDAWARFNNAKGSLPAATEEERTETQLGRAARINQAELDTKRAQALRTGGGQPSTMQRKAYADLMPVYRFFNRVTNAHFFTGSEAERDQVIATLPQFNYEGAAFVVSRSAQPGLSAVHRFYNLARGVHFFTISEAEKTHIQANLPDFRYEGVAYYASATPGTGLKPLFRFYRQGANFHFYSASVTERDHVIETLCDYRHEGTAYYVIDPSASGEPPAARVNATVLLVGDSLTQGYGQDISGDWFSFVSPGRVWSQTLATALPARSGHACNRVVDVSVGGMTTGHGIDRIQGWLDRYRPTHVVLAQGTNDAWQGLDMDGIRANLGAMAQASRNAGSRLYAEPQESNAEAQESDAEA